MKYINSKGDTIIEVLISLAVLSSVLLGAYATANRSQNSNQASQERSEAIKLAESQVENLKSLISNGTNPVDPVYCVNSSYNGYTKIDLAPAPFPDPFNASLEQDTFPYSGDCGNISTRYNAAIKYDSPNKTYDFLVRWNRIGGGRDQINLYYRID